MNKFLNNKKNMFSVLTTLFLVVIMLALMTNLAFAQLDPGADSSTGAGTGDAGTTAAILEAEDTASRAASGGPAAQPRPVSPSSSSGIAEHLIKAISAPALAIVAAALLVLKGILISVVAVSAYLLENVFIWNVSMVPANMGGVQFGWTIMRDIANSLFILIILWIAFTIIFNLENMGGRKLLTRVIVVALLINFSLALVTMVFGFTNMIARVFADQMPAGNITAIIVDAIKLHTIDTQPTADQIRAAQDWAGGFSTPPAGLRGPSFKNTALASLGVYPAEAFHLVLIGAGAGCAATIWLGGVTCVAGAIVGGILGAITEVFADPVSALFNIALRLGMNVIFLLITIAAFLLAALALLMRLVAMIFLSVFAPAAFMLFIIPGKQARAYFEKWLSALIKWAFFAPTFYFLLYLALYMLQQNPNKTLIDASLNPDQYLVIITSLAFLIAAVMLARKTGGVVAETTIGLGKTLGLLALGGAAGFAGKAVMPKLGAMSARMDEKIGEKSPAMQKLLAVPAAGFRRLAAKSRETVSDAQKKYEGMTTEELQRSLPQTFLQTNKTAIIAELAKRRSLAAKEEIPSYEKVAAQAKRKAIDQKKAIGQDYMEILKADPSLAIDKDFSAKDLATAMQDAKAKGMTLRDNNEAAQWAVWSKMSGEDMKKVDLKATFKNETQIKMFVLNGKATQYRELAMNNHKYVEDINKYVNSNPDVIQHMDPGTYVHVNSAAGRELGWTLPATHTKPAKIAAEETLRETVVAARDAVRDAEAAARRSGLTNISRDPGVVRARSNLKDAKGKLSYRA